MSLNKNYGPGKTGHVYQNRISNELYLCIHIPDKGQRLLQLDCELRCNPFWSETTLWGSAGISGWRLVGKLKGVNV